MIYLQRKGLISRSLSGYVRASTDNPTGWRPQYQRLGDLHRGPVRARARLLGLGDGSMQICDPGTGLCTTNSCDPSTDPTGMCIPHEQLPPTESELPSQVNILSQQFQQMNTALRQQEQSLQALGASSSADLRQKIVQLRTDFESYLDKYNTVYRAAFGTVPSIPGLQGLGLEPATAFILAAAITALFASIAVWWQHEQNVAAQVQVQLQQAQSANTVTQQLPAIQKQIVDAQARGDVAAVAALTAQYNATLKAASTTGPGSSTDWSAFLQNNWGWIAAAGVATIVVSKL